MVIFGRSEGLDAGGPLRGDPRADFVDNGRLRRLRQHVCLGHPASQPSFAAFSLSQRNASGWTMTVSANWATCGNNKPTALPSAWQASTNATACISGARGNSGSIISGEIVRELRGA
ncbi:MAG: hypothetical protein IPK52_19740 [Chloroflexi bacterium]|nr:hypothetical protein [Chloroflexota bacterium]